MSYSSRWFTKFYDSSKEKKNNLELKRTTIWNYLLTNYTQFVFVSAHQRRTWRIIKKDILLQLAINFNFIFLFLFDFSICCADIIFSSKMSTNYCDRFAYLKLPTFQALVVVVCGDDGIILCIPYTKRIRSLYLWMLFLFESIM